jgi:PAS domain S-box-containing protein
LLESEERFRELAENIPEAFWVTSPDFNRMIYISPAYETIWGHTCKSLYEHPESWIDNIHPDDRDRVSAALENHTHGKGDFAEEYRIIRPDGSQRWIIDCAYSIKGKSGVTDHIIGVAKNITERKEAEEQIKASLREKEVLLKEIHHRVKNNMQIVSSLLNLQSESVDDENTRQILKKSQNRVKSMALVHEKLYQTEDLSSIDFGEYTRSLTTRLLHSFGEETRGVQLVIDMDEVCLDVNKAIPCGLIINEIVTNSFKHAFTDSTTDVDKNKLEGKGVIKVSMRKNADPESRTSADVETLAQTAGRSSVSAEIAPGQAGIIELVVGDNGIGLPEGLDFRNTKTLGMELVITLVGQLEGSIEYVNKGGTEFKITFEA